MDFKENIRSADAPLRMMHLDLFSGIGGFSLAAQWAGFDTVAFCERDDFCRKVLRKNFGDTPCFDDIHTLTADALRERGVGRVDLVTGGFPCQPFSLAGNRLGAEDDRHLWPEMLRVIHEVRPRWVVGENVAGFISMALDDVLSELEAEGYEAWPLVIPACAVNAPHQRDRVWIVAYAQSEQGDRRERGDLDGAASGREDVHASSGPCGQDVAHAKGAGLTRWQRQGLAGGGVSDGRSPDAADADRQGLAVARRPSETRGANGREIAAPERSMRRPTQPGLCREIDGLPTGLDDFIRAWDGNWEGDTPRTCKGGKNRRKRLQALGNAIVPQVAYHILVAIAEQEALRFGK